MAKEVGARAARTQFCGSNIPVEPVFQNGWRRRPLDGKNRREGS